MTGGDPAGEARARARSFGYALAGWKFLLHSQHNAWIHLAISAAVFLLGTWLGLSRLEWAAIVLAMGLVWTAELLNTAVEAAVDLSTAEDHKLARVAKDTAAGAVLASACAAALVGLLVLGPPLWARLTG